MLSILFLLLAGICNAIMDSILFHWEKSIFKGSKLEWWANPKVSYKNKWKNYSNSEDGEKFPGSSTIFVWVTDLWHFAQSFMITFFVLGVLFYDSIVVIKGYPLVSLLIDFVILKGVFSLTFELFWGKILKKK
tara:strand:- start:676 stop:1074 length:399 start_codon:yes stop_codon:yes gene_type:complete